MAMYPEWAGKLLWGSKVAGLRIVLAGASAPAVKSLVRQAFDFRAARDDVAAEVVERGFARHESVGLVEEADDADDDEYDTDDPGRFHRCEFTRDAGLESD